MELLQACISSTDIRRVLEGTAISRQARGSKRQLLDTTTTKGMGFWEPEPQQNNGYLDSLGKGPKDQSMGYAGLPHRDLGPVGLVQSVGPNRGNCRSLHLGGF